MAVPGPVLQTLPPQRPSGFVAGEVRSARYLILGGAGYIGRALCLHLLSLEPDCEVVLADLVTPAKDWQRALRADQRCRLRWAICDGRQPLLEQLGASAYTRIYNLAAIHREPGHAPAEYFETNLPCAEQVCVFAELTGCTQILFFSSIAVYGPSTGPIDESCPLRPDSAYGASKVAAELVHERWQLRDAQARKLVVVRPGVVYGPGDPGNVLRMIRALQCGLFVRTGAADLRKSYGYLQGLLAALDFALERPDAVQVFNYVERDTLCMRELVDTIRRRLRVRGPCVNLPLPPLMLAAGVIQLLSLGRSEIHPVRVAKAARPTHILPKRLIEWGFAFPYDFRRSLDHWLERAPQDFLPMPARVALERPHDVEPLGDL